MIERAICIQIINTQWFSQICEWSLYILVKLIFLIFSTYTLSGQTTENDKQRLTIELEIRPRAEYRNHFQLTPSDSITPELYVSQRNRLGITWQHKKWVFHTAWQEIHLWGKNRTFSDIGSINAYELYVEPRINKNLSARIGRQGITLDNGRLFSDAPWAQQSRAHEGLRLLYQKNKLASDGFITFTRNYGSLFDPAYSPVASHKYKWLFMHHLKYKINQKWTLLTLNSADIFGRDDKPGRYYTRLTNGGRLEYYQKNSTLTLNAYYQSGKNAGQKNIRAFYLQPEISRTAGKLKLRLGAEIASGGNPTAQIETDRSFVTLYGVAWKFMGNMNFFTRFPADVNGTGLINPYLFAIFKVNPVLSLRADGHLFYTQYRLKSPRTNSSSRYLGYESDLSVNYKPTARFDIWFGFSFLLPTESMVLLRKIDTASVVPVWSYLMVSYKIPIISVITHEHK